MLKEKVKKSKGITLIALIITIIILLILLAVGIDIAMDGQIFNIAEDAVNKTNYKVGEVQNEVYDLEDEMDDIKQWACQHTFGEWVIIKEATETETGTRERVCSKCGYIQRETIPALAKEIPEIALSYSTTQDTWTNDDITAEDKKWTNKNVTVTANFVNSAEDDLSEYTIQMRKDNGNWENGNSLEYESKGKVSARVVKNGSQVGDMIDGEVNIDKTPPIVGGIIGYRDIELENEFGTYPLDPEIGIGIDVTNDGIDTVYIKFINGSDSESGILRTTFTARDLMGIVSQTYVLENSTTTLPILAVNLNSMQEVTSRATGYDEIYYYIEIESVDKAGNTSETGYPVVFYNLK